MKTTKKCLSILLALVMLLSLTVTASAATVNNETAHTYKAYQIFKGTQATDGGALGEVNWGDGINGDPFLTALKADKRFGEGEENIFYGCTDAASVAAALSTYGDNSDVAKAFANVAEDNKSTTCENVPANGETGLDTGYYLVVDVTANLQGMNDAYNSALLQVEEDGDFTIAKKYTVPTVDKEIVDNNSETDTEVGEASIGESIDFVFTGTLPSNYDDYEGYYYVFTDTLSKGLTYNNDLVVKIGGVDVTSDFYKNATAYSETDGTTITVGTQNLKDLDAENDSISITSSSTIVVTYSATLNEKAEVGTTANTNTVDLVFSNNPDDSGEGENNPGTPPSPTKPTGEAPEDTVEVYTTELTVKKTDDENNILPGAEFTLSGDGVKVVLVTTETFTEDADGEYWKLKDGTYTKTAPTNGEGGNEASYDSTTTKYAKTTSVVAKGDGKTETTVVGAVSNDEGTVTFTGLGAGEYTLTESKIPAGYNGIEPIEFTVTFDASTKKFVSSNDAITVGADNKLSTTIENVPGSSLPETGGNGTTVLYVTGGALVLLAVALLVTKRRLNVK